MPRAGTAIHRTAIQRGAGSAEPGTGVLRVPARLPWLQITRLGRQKGPSATASPASSLCVSLRRRARFQKGRGTPVPLPTPRAAARSLRILASRRPGYARSGSRCRSEPPPLASVAGGSGSGSRLGMPIARRLDPRLDALGDAVPDQSPRDPRTGKPLSEPRSASWRVFGCHSPRCLVLRSHRRLTLWNQPRGQGAADSSKWMALDQLRSGKVESRMVVDKPISRAVVRRCEGCSLTVRTGQRRRRAHCNHDSWEARGAKTMRMLFNVIAWPRIQQSAPKPSLRRSFDACPHAGRQMHLKFCKAH